MRELVICHRFPIPNGESISNHLDTKCVVCGKKAEDHFTRDTTEIATWIYASRNKDYIKQNSNRLKSCAPPKCLRRRQELGIS